MTVMNSLGFRVWGGLVAGIALSLAAMGLGACGSHGAAWGDAGANNNNTLCLGGCSDAGGSSGSGSSSGATQAQLMPAMGTQTAPDCPGCTFPPASAMPCASSAPPINIVYPPDQVLLPPNMNVISVQWTPFGSAFQSFSVDFSSGNSPGTDWHILTKCATQTIDAQSSTASGGCELVVDPLSWSKLVGANRGAGPVTITVRGTTDGTCASTSTNQITVFFAQDDLIGTYFYWKSTISTNGVGGQIWKKDFGDLTMQEQDVTSQSINATCNGCHSLSRDGSRMVVYSDDDDSDDEYSDIAGSYLDMTQNPAHEFPGGVTNGGHGGGGQPPGFSTIQPSVQYYITSNGYPCTGSGGGACARGSGANAYPGPVPTNGYSVWNGNNGMFIDGISVGPANTRPTMPDWSIDGTTLVYVVPAGEFTWRSDDAHIYGGSLYAAPYSGNGTFGSPTLLLQSSGENNYYPSYSPDVPMTYIIFNRVDSMGAGSNCNNGFCPDDSFSNPNARLMLMRAAGATPIDLEKANGSPLTNKVALSNSYPRWAPFVQTYRGNKLLWFTFSSTRDYGVRVLNHKNGMYQCYPADAAETPGAAHQRPFAPQCQIPQLWMAPITLSEAQGDVDPSGVAFWVPYQEITTHNHTAQWVWTPPQRMGDAGTCTTCSMEYGPCGTNGCACCTNAPGGALTCDGNGQCIITPQ
jgi:hypothetical protein